MTLVGPRARSSRGRRFRWLAVALALPLAAASANADPLQDALATIRASRIRAHLSFLADDLLRGRAPGSRGGDVAALYVASAFREAGLEPVGDAFRSPVPLVAVAPDTARTSVTVAGRDWSERLGFGQELVAWPGRADTAADVEGELVFVGYGVVAPEYDWDDYEGRDLSGKVALVLVNDPPAPPEDPALFEGRAMTWYGRWSYKLEEARRHGAAGALLIHTDASAGYPWSFVASSWRAERLRLEDASNGLDVEGWISRDRAAELLARAGRDLDELTVQAARRDFRPVATGLSIEAHVRARTRQVASSNVAGVVRGSDPELRDEYVVYTAHYDHLGVGLAIDGDSIYNGAYDNASGVALLIEAGRAFAAMDPAPARSILFLATTAEESGMLGATQFVRHGPIPVAAMVAEINIDGANLWGETSDVIGLGIDRSTLGSVLDTAAAQMDLTVHGDRAPEKGYFFRSDQFPFARAGVPALFLEHGTTFRGRPSGWGEDQLTRYQAERYHQPGDEYTPAMDLSGAVQQARLAVRIGYAVANTAARPRWLQGGRPPASEPRR